VALEEAVEDFVAVAEALEVGVAVAVAPSMQKMCDPEIVCV
jgi:hypothetical protein